MRAVGKNGCVPRGSLLFIRNASTNKWEFSLKNIGGTDYIAFGKSYFHPEGTTGGITYPALYLKGNKTMVDAWNLALRSSGGDPDLTKLAVGICGRSIFHNASTDIYYFEEGALIYDDKMLYPKDSDCLNARLK